MDALHAAHIEHVLSLSEQVMSLDADILLEAHNQKSLAPFLRLMTPFLAAHTTNLN